MTSPDSGVLAPIAALEPRAITMEEYHRYAPERIELLDGYLFLPGQYPQPRLDLLRLLLVNVGLREAVKLAPESRWREALRQAYGPAAGP